MTDPRQHDRGGTTAADVDELPEREPDELPVPAGGADTAVEPAAAELADRWRRAVADLDNLRKRYARELARERQAEREETVAAWLPILDNLELALEHAESASDPIVAGVRAIRDQAIAAMARLGYQRHDEVGVPFDPSRHEVVGVVDEPGHEQGTVIRVLRPGYGQHDRLLRPAAVVVNRRQDQE